jgi:hypothetical protein
MPERAGWDQHQRQTGCAEPATTGHSAGTPPRARNTWSSRSPDTVGAASHAGGYRSALRPSQYRRLPIARHAAPVDDTSERGRHSSRRLTEIAIWLLIDLSPAYGFRSDVIWAASWRSSQNPRPKAASSQRSLACEARAVGLHATWHQSGTVGTRQSFGGPFRSAARSYPDHSRFSCSTRRSGARNQQGWCRLAGPAWVRPRRGHRRASCMGTAATRSRRRRRHATDEPTLTPSCVTRHRQSPGHQKR